MAKGQAQHSDEISYSAFTATSFQGKIRKCQKMNAVARYSRCFLPAGRMQSCWQTPGGLFSPSLVSAIHDHFPIDNCHQVFLTATEWNPAGKLRSPWLVFVNLMSWIVLLYCPLKEFVCPPFKNWSLFAIDLILIFFLWNVSTQSV